jgi:hypothetical protein
MRTLARFAGPMLTTTAVGAAYYRYCSQVGLSPSTSFKAKDGAAFDIRHCKGPYDDEPFALAAIDRADQRVIGYAAYSKSDASLYLTRVAVEEPSRRQRVGASLVYVLAADASTNNIGFRGYPVESAYPFYQFFLTHVGRLFTGKDDPGPKFKLETYFEGIDDKKQPGAELSADMVRLFRPYLDSTVTQNPNPGSDAGVCQLSENEITQQGEEILAQAGL